MPNASAAARAACSRAALCAAQVRGAERRRRRVAESALARGAQMAPRRAFCTPPPVVPARRSTRAARATPPRCAAARAYNNSVLSWNVNGLRALARHDPRALHGLMDAYRPHVVCLQQTRLQPRHEPLFFDALPRYEHFVFHSSTSRLAFGGTATYSRSRIRVCQRKINHEVGDEEGRMVMIEYPCLFVINVCNVRSGRSLARLNARLSWDRALRKHIRNVRALGKPVMVVGDLAVARHALDVYDERSVGQRGGYSHLERTSLEDTLETCGMVDMFRALHPQRRAFTCWRAERGARERNEGCRTDHVLVSEDMVAAVKSVRILDHVRGSDHCPIVVELTDGIL